MFLKEYCANNVKNIQVNNLIENKSNDIISSDIKFIL